MMIIAEIGINHNGNLNVAKRMIEVAARAGCDAVKFQKRTIDLVYTKEELDAFRLSPWGNTNRVQKEGLEFGKEEYDEIDQFVEECGLLWFASPWDIESVEFLAQYGCEYIKVASALLTNYALLQEIKETDRKVILSTGMSTRAEVEKALQILSPNVEYLLACTSTYPTDPSEMNLNFIDTLKEEYPFTKIGFSNHSPSTVFMTAAIALGIKALEFHLTLDRSMYGSDQASSIEPHGAEIICRNTKMIKQARGDGAWTVFQSEEEIKRKLRREL